MSLILRNIPSTSAPLTMALVIDTLKTRELITSIVTAADITEILFDNIFSDNPQYRFFEIDFVVELDGTQQPKLRFPNITGNVYTSTRTGSYSSSIGGTSASIAYWNLTPSNINGTQSWMGTIRISLTGMDSSSGENHMYGSYTLNQQSSFAIMGSNGKTQDSNDTIATGFLFTIICHAGSIFRVYGYRE